MYEPLTGGVVTSTDPSLLQPGEVVQANNCFFYDDIGAIARAPALSQWSSNVTGNQPVLGLVGCSFAATGGGSGPHYLVAQCSGSLLTANAESDASPFSLALTGRSTAANHLHAVQFDNRYYLFNGVDENVVLLSGGTFRAHGVLPASAPLASASAFTVAPFNGNSTGFYEYWYTETVTFIDGQEVEGTFVGKPLVVSITDVDVQTPVIQFPNSPANTGRLGAQKIHYNLYRSEAKALLTDQLYPVGRRITTVSTVDPSGTPIPNPTTSDSSTVSNTGVKTASTSLTSDTSSNCTVTLTGGAVTVAEALTTNDAKEVVITATSSNVNNVENRGAVLHLYNFSLGSLPGNVVAIGVTARIKTSTTSTGATLVCSIGNRNGTSGLMDHIPKPGGILDPSLVSPLGDYPLFNFSGDFKKQAPINSTTYQDITFGGSTDRWLPGSSSWPISTFDSDFMVSLGVRFGQGAVAGTTVTLDRLFVVVYYNGSISSTQEDNKLYDAIVTETEGVELKFGALDKPPISSTGAVHEGSLVLNDVQNPLRIFWSNPGTADGFPIGVYWTDLPATTGDQVTSIASVNNRLAVGCRGSLWRINHLPNQADATYSRTRPIELISSRVGILNPKSSTLVTDENGRQVLAFVDTNGLFLTDAYSIRPYSEALRWVSYPSGVFLQITDSIYSVVIALLNDPATKTLRLVTANGYHSCSYAPRHMKGTQPKWAGAATLTFSGRNPKSATVIRRNNGVWIPVFGYDGSAGVGGFVYREDANDTSILNNNSRTMAITTRDIYPAGITGEAQLDSLELHGRQRGTAFAPDVDGSLASSIVVTELHGDASENSLSAVTTTSTPTSIFAEKGVVANSRGFRLAITLTDTGMNELNGIILGLTDFQEEDAG